MNVIFKCRVCRESLSAEEPVLGSLAELEKRRRERKVEQPPVAVGLGSAYLAVARSRGPS
jgi:hypothetical protein